MNLKDYIINVKDFPKKGIDFKDITTLIKDPNSFQESIDQFSKIIKDNNIKFDYVVGLDARGFIFGTPLALQEKKGFIPIRKENKLPRETIEKEIITEYSKDKISIHKNDIKKGDKVIIIDDLLATGGSIKATIQLLEELEADIQHIFFVIELLELNGRKQLKHYPISSLVNY